MSSPASSSSPSSSAPEPFVSELRLEPRYSETDAMGFVYYANYLVYFEVARTTALAELGFPYAAMEKDGLLIPVLNAHCEYKRPARYGDVLRIRTRRSRSGRARIGFAYEVLRESSLDGSGAGELVATGTTEHAFMSPEGRPLRPPAAILALFASDLASAIAPGDAAREAP